MTTHPEGGAGTGPGRFVLDIAAALLSFQPPWGKPKPKPSGPPPPKQRCTDERPHGPHPVPARRTWTSFQCAGRPAAAEQARELDEAFGLEPLTS